MWNLIKNEIIKLHYRRKLLITAIVLAVIIILLCIGTFAVSKVAKSVSTPKGQIKLYETSISNLEKQKTMNKKLSEEEKQQMDKDIENIKKEIEKLKEEDEKLSTTSNSDNWQVNLESKVSALEKEKTDLDKYNDPNSFERVNKELLINKNLLDNKIKPLQGTDFTSFTTLQIFFALCSIILVCIIVAILTADIVSGECTPPTMKVLLSRPVSRWKVLLAKYISALCASLIIIVAMELILYLLAGVIFGFQNMSYPIAVGTQFKEDLAHVSVMQKSYTAIVGSTYIIPLWAYMLRALLMQILFIIAAVSFCFLLSSVLKSSSLSMTLSIVFIIVLDIVSKLPFNITTKISSFIFISYGNSLNVIASKLPDNPLGGIQPLQTPLTGIIVLSLWSIGCYVISHLVFTKKDILI